MKSFVIATLTLASIAIGCSDNSHRSQTRSHRSVDSTLLAYTDFDLETVVGVVKENKVKDAKGLEAFVNGSNGVNNVDIDKDGKIDYIRVVESKNGNTIVLDMKAVPSSGGDEVTVASLDFKQGTSDQLVVEGGYPTYVSGHDSHYYSYNTHRGMSMGEAMFLMWLFTPSRPMFIQPMPIYTPRPVYSKSALMTSRVETRVKTKVGPVKSASKPSTYSVKSAQKTQSRLKNTGTSAFRKRDATRTKSAATGFGAKGSKSSTSKSSSSSSKKSGSSWGRSSSGSRSRSWGGGSRSFGGGRRRSSQRYKSNIKDFDVGIAAIQKMNAVNWDWNKSNTKEPTTGFIAEEMAEAFPEAVIYDKAGEPAGIDYSLIVVPLVNSVQYMQEEIKQLQSQCQ